MAIEEILKASSRGPSNQNPQEDANVFTDVLAAPFRGVEGALQGIYDLADYATGDDLLPDYNNRFLGRSQTFAGNMVEGVTQFMTGFVPIAGQASRVGMLTKVSSTGKKVLNLKGYAAAGAVADFTVFQAQEERLSNLIESFPSLSNPVTAYLAADEDDGEIEGRFKNALEGLALGGLADGLFASVKAIKRGRKGDDPQEVLLDLEDVLFSEQRDQAFLKNELTEQTEKFQKAVTEKFGSLENAPTNAYDMLVSIRDGYEGELAPLFDALINNSEATLRRAKFQFKKIDGENTAEYSPKEHSISLEKGGYNTFAHELLHAVTSQEIFLQTGRLVGDQSARTNREIIATLADEANTGAVAGLYRTYDAVVKKLGKEADVYDGKGADVYGLTNIHEFVTEAFTNPEFRKMLSKIPSDSDSSKTIFDTFMEAVRKMLGLSNEQASLLDDVMRDTEGVLRQQEANFESKFDYLKEIDGMRGLGQRRTLDDRGDNTLEEGQKAPVSEMQQDIPISTRNKTLNAFKITWGVPFRGMDISNVPDAYLEKSLTFDSLSVGVKNRIALELDSRKTGRSQYNEPTNKQLEKQDARVSKQKMRKDKDKGVRNIEPKAITPVYRTAGTSEQILRGESETPEQLYANYLASRNQTGGKASPVQQRFKEYMEGIEIDEMRRGGTTNIKNPRIQGKSQRESDLIRQKRINLPSDPITDARNRGRMFAEGGLGQRGFYSNVEKAADKIFTRHMEDVKGSSSKDEEINFERLKKLLIKEGDAGTKEELEFRGFDDYFSGAEGKQKISRKDFEGFLEASEFNFEFDDVTSSFTTTEERMIREAEIDEISEVPSRGYQELEDNGYLELESQSASSLERKAYERIDNVNNPILKQKGDYTNPRNYALREPEGQSQLFLEGSKTQDLNVKLQSNASGHFGDDVIYHVRTTDRQHNGKKVLYIEEIQSDLHTAFKKQAFNRWRKNLYNSIWEKEMYIFKNPESDVAKEGSPYRQELKRQRDLFDDFAASREFYDKNIKKVDEKKVPFIQNGFQNNAARQLLKMAAEGGYDAVWLPSGEMIQQIYGQGNKYGFYDKTYRDALEKAAKNLDKKYTKLRPSRTVKREMSQRDIQDYIDTFGKEAYEEYKNSSNKLIEEPAFKGGFGIKISDDMKAKAQEEMPMFGQRDIDQSIEDSISRLANDLETGGDQAVLNAAKGIRSTTQAVALVQAIARNLTKAETAKAPSYEELVTENAELVGTLGGKEADYAATIASLNKKGVGLTEYRNAQKAVYKLIDTMSSEVVDLANKAKEARSNPNLNKEQLEVEFLSSLDQLNELQRIWSLMGREAAFTMLQRKFLLDPSGKYRVKQNIGFDSKAATPNDYARYKNESQVGTMTAEKMVDTIAGAKDALDAKKRIKKTSLLAKETMGGKAMDVIMEYWMNSLLSGPTTQVVNLLGNSLTMTIRVLEQATGALLTANPALARATLRYGFDAESIADSFKVAAQTWGKQEATLTQGSRMFDDTLGQSQSIAADGDSVFAKAINALGTVVRVPSRALLVGDEFFKQMNYRSYVKTQLAYEAMQKGAKGGTEIAEYVQKNFDNFITAGARAYNEKGIYLDAVQAAQAKGLMAGKEQDEFIQEYLEKNKFDETRGGLADAALGYAEENTFTKDLNSDTALGTLSEGLNNLKNKGGFWQTLNFVIPFLRTPTNILQFALDRTPLGNASELVFRREKLKKEIFSDDPTVRAQAVGRLATSTAVVSSALYYVATNKEFITGGGPPNRDELEALRMSGWRPYSIKVNGTYISYQRTDPIATVLGLFADIVEGYSYNDLDGVVGTDMMAITVMALTNNVTNKSYVKGLDTLLDVVRDPVGNFKPFVGNIAGGFAPTLLTQAQNMADERVLRETRTAFDYFLRRVPVVESTLPSRRNFLGEEMINKNSPYMTGIINPFYPSKESTDIVDRELATLQHGFSQPPTKLHNAIEMRDVYNADGRQAFDRMLELSGTTKIAGKTLRQQLRAMMNSEEYQILPVESSDELGEKSPRIKAVQNLVRVYRRKAQFEMLNEFPELKQSVIELQQGRLQYRDVQ